MYAVPYINTLQAINIFSHFQICNYESGKRKTRREVSTQAPAQTMDVD
jgi:hypothetical protein